MPPSPQLIDEWLWFLFYWVVYVICLQRYVGYLDGEGRWKLRHCHVNLHPVAITEAEKKVNSFYQYLKEKSKPKPTSMQMYPMFCFITSFRFFSRWLLTCCLQTVLKLWKVKCLVVRFLRAAAAALITLTPFLLRLHLLSRQQAQAGLPVTASYLQPRPTCNPTKAQAAKGKRNNVTPQPFKKNSSSEKHL